VLEQVGLVAAVETVAESLPLPVQGAIHPGRLPAAVESTAYFVICEALVNVVKHAGAVRHVRIRLDGCPYQLRNGSPRAASPNSAVLAGRARPAGELRNSRMPVRGADGYVSGRVHRAGPVDDVLRPAGAHLFKEAAMAMSDNLMRLSVRAKQAEDRVTAATTQARDKLEQDVQEARENTQATADRLRSETVAATDGLQQSWSAHVAQARGRIDARKARHDAKVAERNAQDADDYAAFAIDFAYSAIEQAEYAVLDAVLARLDADTAADAATP
jgi:hypothetical protein